MEQFWDVTIIGGVWLVFSGLVDRYAVYPVICGRVQHNKESSLIPFDFQKPPLDIHMCEKTHLQRCESELTLFYKHKVFLYIETRILLYTEISRNAITVCIEGIFYFLM